MLLWESLAVEADGKPKQVNSGDQIKRAVRGKRLPYDKRCAALARSGQRCKGRIREGSDYCTFHDPAMTAERRKGIAAKGGKSKRNLAHLPSGYLRKLNSRQAVGQAMDQLYREIRLGMLTLEMGRVLFDILTRILDSGLCDQVDGSGTSSKRSRAARLRPKLNELLTQQEISAWRKAVANAPEGFLKGTPAALLSGDSNGKTGPDPRRERDREVAVPMSPDPPKSGASDDVPSPIRLGGLSVAT